MKGKPPRPNIKPSSGGDKQASSSEQRAKGSAKIKRRGHGSKRSRLMIDEDRFLRPDGIPDNARFKGYEDDVVQDLEVRPRNIRYRRDRWELPDGTTLTTDLPANTRAHYGGERRLVLSLYHRSQMTVPQLTRQLTDLGVLIHQGQVKRLYRRKEDLLTVLNGPKCRYTPTGRRTISAATSPSVRSPAVPVATTTGIAGKHTSA